MDPVSTQRIIDLVKTAGSDAVLDGDMLRVYPKDGAPVAYQVPPDGLRRRVIIEIGKRTGIPSHLFWSQLPPEEARASMPRLQSAS